MVMVSGTAHPNICRLLQWFEGQDTITLILERPQPCVDVSEYCRERRLSEQEASAILRQVVLAAKHCHDHGVLHRDIKAENLLINTNNNTVKLIDFGCGELLRDGHYENFSGMTETILKLFVCVFVCACVRRGKLC